VNDNRVTVIAVGTEERGDPSPPLRVAHALRSSADGEDVDLLIFECAELAFEHTLSILDTQFAIFMVVADGIDAPYVFRELTAEDTASAASLQDEVKPAHLIHLLETMDRNHAAPAAFVLAVNADGFASEGGVSVAGQTRVEEVMALLRELLHDPERRHWRGLLTAD
jgi:hypothetical protein